MGINQTVGNKEKENIGLRLLFSFVLHHYLNQIKNYKKAKSKREKGGGGGGGGGRKLSFIWLLKDSEEEK